MNLGDMANFIGVKVRKTDDDSLTACRDFLRQRYAMLWADQLWKASVSVVQVTLTGLPLDVNVAERPYYREGVLLMPMIVDKVLAIRTADAPLDVRDEVELFRGWPNEYEDEGEPLGFLVQRPAVCMLGNGYQFQVQVAASDSEAVMSMDYLITESGEAARWSGAINIQQDFDGLARVERFTKPATNSTVTLRWEEGPTIREMATYETEAPRRQCVRLVPIPSGAETLRVLAKRAVLPLAIDTDTPELPGVENCLMAFAQGDMLQRERAYAKAKELHSEGNVLLEQLKKVETVQQANRARFIPSVESYYEESAISKGYW